MDASTTPPGPAADDAAAAPDTDPHGRWVLCFASDKGGTGKTTLALHVAAHLRSCGLRTVLVDLDLLGSDVLSLAQKVPDDATRVRSVADLLGVEMGAISDPDFLVRRAGRRDRLTDVLRDGLASIRIEASGTTTPADAVALWPSRYPGDSPQASPPELWMSGFLSGWMGYRLSELLAVLLHPGYGDYQVVVLDNGPFQAGISEAVERLFVQICPESDEEEERKKKIEALGNMSLRREVHDLFHGLALASLYGDEGRQEAERLRLAGGTQGVPQGLNLHPAVITVHTTELPTLHHHLLKQEGDKTGGTFLRWHVLNRVPQDRIRATRMQRQQSLDHFLPQLQRTDQDPLHTARLLQVVAHCANARGFSVQTTANHTTCYSVVPDEPLIRAAMQGLVDFETVALAELTDSLESMATEPEARGVTPAVARTALKRVNDHLGLFLEALHLPAGPPSHSGGGAATPATGHQT